MVGPNFHQADGPLPSDLNPRERSHPTVDRWMSAFKMEERVSIEPTSPESIVLPIYRNSARPRGIPRPQTSAGPKIVVKKVSQTFSSNPTVSARSNSAPRQNVLFVTPRSDPSSGSKVSFSCNVTINQRNAGVKDAEFPKFIQAMESSLFNSSGKTGESSSYFKKCEKKNTSGNTSTSKSDPSPDKKVMSYQDKSECPSEIDSSFGYNGDATPKQISVNKATDPAARKPPAVSSNTVFFISLDLSENFLTCKSVGILARWFITNNKYARLRVLKMFKNMIGDAGAELIAELLINQCSPLEELHLSHNKITGKGAAALFKSISHAGAVKNPGSFTYPRSESSRSTSALPIWVRLEYNQIRDSQEILKKWEEECRSLRKYKNNLKLVCFADRASLLHGSKDPHCSPARCLRSVGNRSPLLHLYSFHHQACFPVTPSKTPIQNIEVNCSKRAFYTELNQSKSTGHKNQSLQVSAVEVTRDASLEKVPEKANEKKPSRQKVVSLIGVKRKLASSNSSFRAVSTFTRAGRGERKNVPQSRRLSNYGTKTVNHVIYQPKQQAKSSGNRSASQRNESILVRKEPLSQAPVSRTKPSSHKTKNNAVRYLPKQALSEIATDKEKQSLFHSPCSLAKRVAVVTHGTARNDAASETKKGGDSSFKNTPDQQYRNDTPTPVSCSQPFKNSSPKQDYSESTKDSLTSLDSGSAQSQLHFSRKENNNSNIQLNFQQINSIFRDSHSVSESQSRPKFYPYDKAVPEITSEPSFFKEEASFPINLIPPEQWEPSVNPEALSNPDMDAGKLSASAECQGLLDPAILRVGTVSKLMPPPYFMDTSESGTDYRALFSRKADLSHKDTFSAFPLMSENIPAKELDSSKNYVNHHNMDLFSDNLRFPPNEKNTNFFFKELPSKEASQCVCQTCIDTITGTFQKRADNPGSYCLENTKEHLGHAFGLGQDKEMCEMIGHNLSQLQPANMSPSSRESPSYNVSINPPPSSSVIRTPEKFLPLVESNYAPDSWTETPQGPYDQSNHGSSIRLGNRESESCSSSVFADVYKHCNAAENVGEPLKPSHSSNHANCNFWGAYPVPTSKMDSIPRIPVPIPECRQMYNGNVSLNDFGSEMSENFPLYVFLDASAYADMRLIKKKEKISLFSFPGIYSLSQKKVFCYSSMLPINRHRAKHLKKDHFDGSNMSVEEGAEIMDPNNSVVLMLVNSSISEGLVKLAKDHPFLKKSFATLKAEFVEPLLKKGIVRTVNHFSPVEATQWIVFDDEMRAMACSLGVPLDALQVLDFAFCWAYKRANTFYSKMHTNGRESNLDFVTEKEALCGKRDIKCNPRFAIFLTQDHAVEKFFEYLDSIQQAAESGTQKSRASQNIIRAGDLICLSMDKFNNILREAYPKLAVMIVSPESFEPTPRPYGEGNDILSASTLRQILYRKFLNRRICSLKCLPSLRHANFDSQSKLEYPQCKPDSYGKTNINTGQSLYSECTAELDKVQCILNFFFPVESLRQRCHSRLTQARLEKQLDDAQTKAQKKIKDLPIDISNNCYQESNSGNFNQSNSYRLMKPVCSQHNLSNDAPSDTRQATLHGTLLHNSVETWYDLPDNVCQRSNKDLCPRNKCRDYVSSSAPVLLYNEENHILGRPTDEIRGHEGCSSERASCIEAYLLLKGETYWKQELYRTFSLVSELIKKWVESNQHLYNGKNPCSTESVFEEHFLYPSLSFDLMKAIKNESNPSLPDSLLIRCHRECENWKRLLSQSQSGVSSDIGEERQPRCIRSFHQHSNEISDQLNYATGNSEKSPRNPASPQCHAPQPMIDQIQDSYISERNGILEREIFGNRGI